MALVVGELSANAVQHGRVPGREFGVRLTVDRAAALLRVEVDDAASTKRLPAAPPPTCPEGESGRGLLLVDVLAVRWGSTPRCPLGKRVWAELSLDPLPRTIPVTGANAHPTAQAAAGMSPGGNA